MRVEVWRRDDEGWKMIGMRSEILDFERALGLKVLGWLMGLGMTGPGAETWMVRRDDSILEEFLGVFFLRHIMTE